VTDSVDGYLARKRNQVTVFGKFMDPLADKLLITAALVSFVEKGYINSWSAIIIISREFIVTGIRLVAVSENKIIEANSWGKIKTISQISAIILILINSCVLKVNIFNIDFISVIVVIVVGLTVYSGYDYVKKNWKFINFK
jgi:CDP-diacylglycerol--glycerol-3-phosphate 3-phosphatidyltransferase